MSCGELCQKISTLQGFIDRQLRNLFSRGEPGENEIKAFLHEYGTRLGQLIRQAVDKKDWEPNLESFLTHYGHLHSCHHKTVVTQNEEQAFQIEHCPVIDYCPGVTIMHMGKVFCQLDRAVLKGFNPELWHPASYSGNCLDPGTHPMDGD